MCNPAVIPLITTLVSTGLQVQQQRAQGEYQQGVAEYNARVAENTAQEVRNAANESENAQRLRTAMLISRQRARQAASNIDINSGSALQVQQDALALGEADALRIRSNAASQVGALGTEATLTRSQGSAARMAGRNAATGSFLSGVGSAFGSGVADKWFTPDSAATVAAENNKVWYDDTRQNVGGYV